MTKLWFTPGVTFGFALGAKIPKTFDLRLEPELDGRCDYCQ